MGQQVSIIGAGIVGICSALALLERGYSVTLYDRAPPASGASHGNAGVISPWTCVPQSMPGLWRNIPKWLLDPEGPVSVRLPYALRFAPWAMRFIGAANPDRLPGIGDDMSALNRPNLSLYRKLLEGTGQEHLVVDSWYVHVFRDPAQANPDSLGWQMRRERDVPFRVLNADELREIEPALSRDIKAAMLIESQGRALSPGDVGQALFAKALAQGLGFQQTRVRGINASGDGWAVHTDDGTEHTPRLLLTAGAWSARLLAPLGIRLPLEAERGYHVVLKNPGVRLNNSIMDSDHKFVASSMAAGVRVAGTAEFAGLDTDPDYRRAEVLIKHARALVPDINTADVDQWMGARPSFPDSLPVIGEVPGHGGLFAALGHSHYGFGMAPNTGRLIARLIHGEAPGVDMTPYRLDRFQASGG